MRLADYLQRDELSALAVSIVACAMHAWSVMPLPPPPSACRWPRSTRRRCSSISTPSSAISQRMADFVRKAGVRLRPHAKTHKSPDHRARQVALGAVGRVLPEGVGGRGDGGRRHRRRARLQRGGGGGASSTGSPRWRGAPGSACASMMPTTSPRSRRLRPRRARARRAGGDRRRRPALRRGAGRAGGAPRGARRGLAAPALCRPAGLPRLGPARARGAASARAHIARAVAHVEETLRA